MQIEKYSTYRLMVSEQELMNLAQILWSMSYNTNTDSKTREYAAEYKVIIDESLGMIR